MSSRYVFVRAALAWADRMAEDGLRHYLGAGLAAAFCASLVTLLAMNAEPIAKLGTIAVDFVFPLGCSAVVWKVRQIASPWLSAAPDEDDAEKCLTRAARRVIIAAQSIGKDVDPDK